MSRGKFTAPCQAQPSSRFRFFGFQSDSDFFGFRADSDFFGFYADFFGSDGNDKNTNDGVHCCIVAFLCFLFACLCMYTKSMRGLDHIRIYVDPPSFI